ncbi:hypothetical protein GGI17_006180 [Coemansia sp. S146]|nr:hypothetical protein GGI17_006180 [Coemansia sp. S146]
MDPVATTAQPAQEANLIAGENIDLVVPSDQRYNYSDDFFVRSICRRDCSTVCKLAIPCDSTLSTMADELASKIAADLETRLSMAAQHRKPYANYGGATYYNYPLRKGHVIDSLDDWAMDILKWTDTSVSTVRVDRWHSNNSEDSGDSGDSEYSDDLELTSLEADYVAPSYESFFLFVVHHVKAHISEQGSTGLFKPEDCRLILPIAKEDTDDDDTDIYSAGRDDPTEFTDVEFGMFPLSSSVGSQAAPAPHLIVANVEIVRHLDEYNEAELKLVRKTKELFINQHYRRFAWGLAASCRAIHVYVFGPDGICQSNKIDFSDTEGRLAFISLLVDWSLCSVDCLGFDPTFRYVVNGSVGDPYLEINVHDMNETETFTGRHDRYFAVSTSPEILNTPEFLVKDVGTISNSGSTSDMRKSSFLNELHDESDSSSEFSGRFSRLISTGPVYVRRGGKPVADSTVTAFAGLPDTTQVRQHRRTVVQWAGNPISAAETPSCNR